jgi:lipopolysaccharide export system permease protein
MAPPTVRTISRYLLRQHVAPLGFALAALTSLMLINQVAKQLSSLLGKGLPTLVIIEVFVLSVPFIVAVTLPMAVLVAVLHVFTRLAGDNEITAMHAGGISVGRLIAPVLAGAVGVALLSFAWNDQVLPRSNHRLRTLQVDIQRKKPSLTLKENVINEVVAGQFFLRAARIDGSSNKLRDVTLYDLGDAERRRIITADSGRMAYSSGGRDLYLTLEDGDIQAVNRTDPTQFDRTFFRVNRMRVTGVGNTLELTANDAYKSDREMSICEMRQAARAARGDVDRARQDGRRAIENDLRRLAGLAMLPPIAGGYLPDTAPPGLYCRALRRLTRSLLPRLALAQTPRAEQQPARAAPRAPLGPAPAAIIQRASPRVTSLLVTPGAGLGEEQRVRAALQREASYEVEIQKKYAIAAACLVFALVGAPLALRFQRGGVGLVIGASVAVFTVYYVGLIGGEELGNRLFISPFLAMWTPNILFALVGLGALWRIRKPGNSPHGGDWSDVREGLVRAIARLRRTGARPGEPLRWQGAP